MFDRLPELPRRALPLALTIALTCALGACKTGPSTASTAPIPDAAPTPTIKPTTIRPTRAPTTTPIPSHPVSVAGVQIAVPDSLGAAVEAIEVPAEIDAPQPQASGVRFTLKDYPIRRDRPATVELRRGPLDLEAGKHVMSRFQEMYKFISKSDPQARYIPIFAQPTVREQFVAQVSFRGIGPGTGRGARAITQFGNAVRPVNNQELVYVFEGLIRDNAVWVSIIAPVTVDDPAIAADTVVADPAAFARDYTTYIRTTVERLNALPSTAFTPDLAHLDAIAKSFRLDWPTPSPEDYANAGVANP